MSRRRSTAASAALAILLVLLTVAGVGPATGTASAAPNQPEDDDLGLTIDSLSPTHLSRGKPITMSGQITNRTDHAWTDLQVYLVMPAQPITTRDALDTALEDPSAVSTGERLIDFEALARAGDLGPGDTTSYRLNVPYRLLSVSAVDGVYPIGVQVLATDENGERSNEAVGRAYTLMPSMQGRPGGTADTALVWPFATPIQRRTDGTYRRTKALIDSVSPGGRLRRLLDLARSGGSTPATILVDPALLDALDDIVHGSYGPSGPDSSSEATPSPSDSSPSTGAESESPSSERADARPAQEFLDEFVAFARKHPVWSVAYGRPDMKALTKKGSRKRGKHVATAARTAARSTLERFGIEARPVFWPADGLTSEQTLKRVRALGNQAAIVSPTVVSEWDESAGSMQRIGSGRNSMPVLVDDPPLKGGESQSDSALATRQRIVSETALAALEGGAGADPLVGLMVDPSWDPGTEWSRSNFFSAFDVPWAAPVDADRRLRSTLPTASVELPDDVRPTPIKRGQVRAAAAIVRRSRVLTSVMGIDRAREAYYDETAGLSASVNWRAARKAGRERAQAHRDKINDLLGQVSVEVTQFNTLSGKSGQFPITITNHLDAPVNVGVRMRSDDPTVRIDDIEPAEIGPGQSRTVTVHANVGEVSNSAVTARLVAPDGKTFGEPNRFSVRSSVVGVVIWIGMGIAGLLVVAAIGRRLWRRKRGRAPDGPR